MTPVCSTSGANYCSTGPNATNNASTAPYYCSTVGGASYPPPNASNGSIACSTAGSLVTAGSCSTQGNMASSQGSKVFCSTMTGSHQACSSGWTPAGETVFCSATPGANASTNDCSVQSNSTSTYQNKCSMLDKGFSAAGSTLNCSVAFAGAGAQSTDVSSVVNTFKNAACTTWTGGGKATYQCSALNASGGIDRNSQKCSVINSSGAFVSGPVSGRCGKGTGHETDWN